MKSIITIFTVILTKVNNIQLLNTSYCPHTHLMNGHVDAQM